MRLVEALQILKQPAGERSADFHLLCGFSPLHLETFTRAHLRARLPQLAMRVHTGLFGDLEGNLRRAAETPASGALAVIEWSDLDPRLSYRATSEWSDAVLEDIRAQVQERCARLEAQVRSLAAAMPVALAAPTLPLPEIGHFPPSRSSAFEIRLQAILAEFLERLSAAGNVRLLRADALATRSPAGSRYDAKLDLRAGFPYTLAHADAVAALGVMCVFPSQPKKGLITDLDHTLWKGILGDDGVEGISWNLDKHSQEHAIYQRALASLAASGVLVGVASKNNPELVQAALGRSDAQISPAQIFPVEANWGAKSESVGRILRAWNIAADSVVFVDDSALELAEVAEKHPDIECLRFPSGDPAGVFELVAKLRERFGKNEVREEDRVRLESLRAAASLEESRAQEAGSDFLARLEAKITLDLAPAAADARPFELVNKTNQFNLNGRRFTEPEWSAYFEKPGAFVLTVSYEDRFGPLGRIAVAVGRVGPEGCRIDSLVMSCRAFSRHIEYQVVRKLLRLNGDGLTFAYEPTSRNGPLQDFLGIFFPGQTGAAGELHLTTAAFERCCPPLFQQVTETGAGISMPHEAPIL